jgi:hypothetical protein
MLCEIFIGFKHIFLLNKYFLIVLAIKQNLICLHDGSLLDGLNIPSKYSLRSFLSLWCLSRRLLPVSDLPIGLIDWSLGPQNLWGLRTRCILFLTLLLDYHTYAVITYCTF